MVKSLPPAKRRAYFLQQARSGRGMVPQNQRTRATYIAQCSR
jgi:hypothetical protein